VLLDYREWFRPDISTIEVVCQKPQNFSQSRPASTVYTNTSKFHAPDSDSLVEATEDGRLV
jgi:hypothetical protein